MKVKWLKRTVPLLLALILIASLLPGSSIPAEAAEPTWILPSGDPTDSMTVNQNAGFSARMQYTGIADAAGKFR